MTDIADAKILIVATDGFEQSELLVPHDKLSQRHATVHVATPEGAAITGWDETDWGEKVEADLAIADANAADYDALVLPGGQINPDKLRVNQDALALIGAFAEAGKPIAAICHAPWLLIEAGLAKGRTMTSFQSIRTDLRNAGAEVVDREVATDGNVITSRSPEDLDAFVGAIVDAVEGAGEAIAA